MAEDLVLEQLVYGWSSSNAFGRRGFGVIAMSARWQEWLAKGDDLLGPVVSYPEPGPRGSHPPPHGGFAMLGGLPVVFRRLPSGADALDRPGNYLVHVLAGCPETPLTADVAAALLAVPPAGRRNGRGDASGGAEWLHTSLPPLSESKLPVLRLPKPDAARGSANASAAACGAVLQGLRDGRRVVLAAPSEEAGRGALCDAIRRLPKPLVRELTFSTLESVPQRSGFDVSVAVAGWEADGARAGAAALRVDLADGSALDPECRRWGQSLASASAPITMLSRVPEIADARGVGLRLDALATLNDDPARLSAEQLLSVLTSEPGREWAKQPAAVGVVRSVIATLDPAQLPQFAAAVPRRGASADLLRAAGWDAVRRGRDGDGRRGAALLRGLGEPEDEIDLAVLSSKRGSNYSREESAAYLRLVAKRGAGFGGDPVAAKIMWDERLMPAYPSLWLEYVLSFERYRGPRASRAVVEALDPEAVGAALASARVALGSLRLVAERLWPALPTRPTERIAFLSLLARSSSDGLGLVFDELLAQPGMSPQVRQALLERFWPRIVHGFNLPGYFAESLRAAGPGGNGRAVGAVVLLVVALAALALGWVLGG